MSAHESVRPGLPTARVPAADAVPPPAPPVTPRDPAAPPFGREDDRVWACRVRFARVAASDLQKRVLFELERHWAHVPGPLTQGFSFTGAGLAEIYAVDELEGLLAVLDVSAAISAQIHGVPS